MNYHGPAIPLNISESEDVVNISESESEDVGPPAHNSHLRHLDGERGQGRVSLRHAGEPGEPVQDQRDGPGGGARRPTIPADNHHHDIPRGSNRRRSPPVHWIGITNPMDL